MKDATKDYINVGNGSKDTENRTGWSYRAHYDNWPDWAETVNEDNMMQQVFCYAYTMTAPVAVVASNRYCTGYM